MDLRNVITMLRKQRAKLDAIIRELAHQRTTAAMKSVKRRPGRRFMSAEERQQAAKRMKSYWAERRTRDADPS